MGKHWLPWERKGLGLQKDEVTESAKEWHPNLAVFFMALLRVLDFPTGFLLEGTPGWYYDGSPIWVYTDGYAVFLLETTVGRESSVISPATTTLSGISWIHYHAPPRAAHTCWWPILPCCCLVAKLCLTLQPLELQYARIPCPSLSPTVCSNSCPLSQRCHPTISSSVVPFFSCLQSFPTSGKWMNRFLMTQLFTSGGQSIGASALVSILHMNIQDWFPLGSTDLISL